MTSYEIAGLSNEGRIPRIGKLRLGIKKRSKAGAEYPSEVPWIVSKEEDFSSAKHFAKFREIYGEKPTEIDIMFPVEDRRVFFPQNFKKYGGGGLRCRGDGINFYRVEKDTGVIEEGTCPGPESCPYAFNEAKGRVECKAVGNLSFLVPRVTWNGTFQIDTGSKTAILAINGAIRYYRPLAGRISFVPFKLRRTATEIAYQGKKSTHYVLGIFLPDDANEIAKQLTAASRVRSIFEIFQPGGGDTPLTIEAPKPNEIEDDLHTRAQVAEHKRGGGTTRLPPPKTPIEEDEPPGEPEESERIEVEVERLCPIDKAPLGADAIVYRGEEFCSFECAAKAKEMTDRISKEPEIEEDAEKLAAAKKEAVRGERVKDALAKSGKAGPKSEQTTKKTKGLF